MAKVSAGILLYRRAGKLELLLVHPGGPLWERKDNGAWSIPKGLVESDEDHLAAALREFTEETGCTLETHDGILTLTPRKQPSGKIVHAFAIEGECDAAAIISNTFEMEWPPHSGRMQSFPEVDRAAWFERDRAVQKISSGQIGFIEELVRLLA